MLCFLVCQKLSTDVSFILSSLVDNDMTNEVQLVAETFGIVLIRTFEETPQSVFSSTGESSEMVLQFKSPTATLLLAIRDIVQQEHMTNAAIIYDSSFGICFTLFLHQV